MAKGDTEQGARPAEAAPSESVQEQAQRYADQGYDVTVRGGAVVLETPNPRTTDDDYFHGANPHKVGFGSRGAVAEGGGHGDLAVEPGQSTADAQAGSSGAGWNVHAGSLGDASTEPDESWTNARIVKWAEARGVETQASMNKRELLDAVRASSSGSK